MDGAVELSEVIRQLRREISIAMLEGEAQELRFEAGDIELELMVGVETARGPEGKVRLWVFEVGASLHATSSTTQRIRMTLKPRHAGAPHRSAMIAGEPLPGED
jgi:hypothetical protein